MSIGNLVAQCWEQSMREYPWPYAPWWFLRLTYRERLDLPPRNFYGELIPRIVIVRQNLRRLKEGW